MAQVSCENHPNLSFGLPDFVVPKDECKLLVPTIDPSYSTFMEQLTYTTKQMPSVESGCDRAFTEHFETSSLSLPLWALDG